MQQQKHTTIRYKVTISYLILVILAVAAISILYNGIHNIILLDTDTTNPNHKLKYINQLLTDVYEAEGSSRSYFLFRNDTDLVQYIQLTNKIGLGIDSLRIICKTNPNQITNLNEIDTLLNQKHQIIGQLIELNKSNFSDLSYSRVLDEVYLNSYEDFNQPVIVQETKNIKHDSVYAIEEKTGLFNKVKKIFSSSSQPDNKHLTKTSVEQVTTYDTLYQPIQFSDSLLRTLKIALTNFKSRNDFVKQKTVSQETQLLHSDRIILERIRNIISSLETEEFIHTSTFLDKSREIIKQANYSVLILGFFAFVLVFIFLFIIYKDIARSKAYETELMRARQYSDDLVKMKEQFVAAISHEIRTPLSAIVGLSEQLKKTTATEYQTICIENIELASRSLHALVNNVLDISKSNAGKIELEYISFNFKNTVEEIHRTLANEASRKNLTFNIHLEESTNCLVFGDKYRFSQIITNIVNNALKFTDSGMVDIIGKMSENENGKVDSEIIIFDTGIGIPEDKITDIFDEFTQANTDITRRFGGTGLGLSIASKLTKLMGGNINVSSKEGQGSTFIIQIPFDINIVPKVSTPAKKTIPDAIKKVNILVVEDDETLRILISQLFASNRLQGNIASNGNMALELVQQQQFDIIFTDLQMPGISGIELCQKLKEILPKPIPIIAFSARSTISENYNDYGFSGYLPKPFTESEFLYIISTTLHLHTTELETIIPIMEEHPNKEYSFQKLAEFTEGDNESLRNIVNAFIENTHSDLEKIQNSILNNDSESIAKQVHKLLPMFRQLQINRLIDEMQMIERYEELNLPVKDVMLFAENFSENARKIIIEIKNDMLFTQS